MTRAFFIIGSLALMAAVAVVVWPRPVGPPTANTEPSSPVQSIPKQESDTGEARPKNVPASHGEHAHTATVPVTSPVIPEHLPEAVSSSTDYAIACGRPTSLTIPSTTSEEPRLIQPISAQGEGELIFRSTLGGVEQARYLMARWRVEEGQIHFTVGAQRAVLTLNQGRWASQTPNVEPATLNGLTNLARVIHALHQALPAPRSLAGGEQLTFAGESFSVWSISDGTMTLIAPADAGVAPTAYPPTPGAWNDLRLAVDVHGRIQRAERMVASPSTPQDPGFLVRRILVKPDAEGQPEAP